MACLAKRRRTYFLLLTLLAAGTPALAQQFAREQVSLVFVGDIMVAQDEETGKLIERGVDPFQPFAGLLDEADFAVGNLECVVAESGEPIKKPYNFRAHPRCLPLLKRHFDVLSVANNHSGDFGKDAFAEQCDLLERANIPYFGGGRNLSAARKPWIIELHGVRIALLGYCEVYLASFQAEAETPGVAWSAHDEQVLEDIRLARSQYHCDVVIPCMHWGPENRLADERQKSFARKMIDTGADVIVGGHPHVTQGVEYYNGHLIVYSLGNFVFNGFTNKDNLTGWALRLEVDQRGMRKWDIVIARLDDHGVPHPDWNSKAPSGRAGSAKIITQQPKPATRRRTN